jgi:hypothetical protein
VKAIGMQMRLSPLAVCNNLGACSGWTTSIMGAKPPESPQD